MIKETASQAAVEWIWRHFAITVPADWEMLQFSTEYARGRCAFADRYQFRAELSWKVVTGEPDYNRMVADYMQRLASEKKIEAPSRIALSGWHGFHGRTAKGETTRLGKYMPAGKCLVELVLIWPDQRNTGLEGSIAASIHEVGPDQHNRHRWQAFGMEMHVPTAAAISGCTAMPGLVDFHFYDPKTGNSFLFKRAGMLDAWFDGNLERWLGKAAGPLRDPLFKRRTIQGRDVFTLEGLYTPEGLHLRKGHARASAWICREDGRIYCAVLRIKKPDPAHHYAPEELLNPAPRFVFVP